MKNPEYSLEDLLNSTQHSLKLKYFEELSINTLKAIPAKALREIIFTRNGITFELFDLLTYLPPEKIGYIFSDSEESELLAHIQEQCHKLVEIVDEYQFKNKDESADNFKEIDNLYVELNTQLLQLYVKVTDCQNDKDILIKEAQILISNFIKFHDNNDETNVQKLLSIIEGNITFFHYLIIPLMVFKLNNSEDFKSTSKYKIISIFNRCFKSPSKPLIEKAINSLITLVTCSDNKIYFEFTKLNLSNKNFLPALSLAENYNNNTNIVNRDNFSEVANLLIRNIPDFYKDSKNNLILSSFISSAAKCNEPKIIIKIISKVFGLRIKNSQNKKEYDRESQKEMLLLMQIPILILGIEKISNIQSLSKIKEFAYASTNIIFNHAIKASLLKIDTGTNFTELLFSKLRNPSDFALFVKLVHFTHDTLCNKAGTDEIFDNYVSDFDKARTSFSTILASMLMPNLERYKNLRYRSKLFFNRDLHLFYSKREDLENIWTGDHPALKIQDGMNITLSDNPYDMLFCAQNHCQSCLTIQSSNLKQVALWGIILDGRNKMIIVKNNQGEIVSRCILRLMFKDNYKDPCLLMEEVYPKDNDKYTQIITDFALKIADEMQLSLYSRPEEFYNGIEISNSEFDTGIEQYADSLNGKTNKNKVNAYAIEINNDKEELEEKKQFVM